MTAEKRVFKWWWGWNPGRIEKWLERSEAEGWNLVGIGFAGIAFSMRRGESRQVVYRIDYQSRVKEDYFQLFRDAGWNLAGQSGGWYFWQQVYTQQKPEIYSDTESLIDRNRRQMMLMAIILMIQYPGLNSTLTRIHQGSTLMSALAFIQGSLILLIVFVLIRFHFANRALVKRRQD